MRLPNRRHPRGSDSVILAAEASLNGPHTQEIGLKIAAVYHTVVTNWGEDNVHDVCADCRNPVPHAYCEVPPFLRRIVRLYDRDGVGRLLAIVLRPTLTRPAGTSLDLL